MSDGSEFIHGPRWRTKTTPRRRRRAVIVTFAMIVVVGTFLAASLIWVLDALGAPRWLAVMVWLAPTLVVAAWALARPSPAIPNDDDDDSWLGYAIRYVVVGEGAPRPAPLRLIAAVVFGAPIGWAVAVFGALVLVGVM